jgi:purine-cytosine permease-like protein
VGLGYFLPTLFQFGFGSVLVLSRGLDPDHPELILVAIAGGGAAAAVALLALTVDETDEAFANTYSAAVSLQNLFPALDQRILIGISSVVATGGALLIDLRSYQAFLFLLGSFFVPLLGVLIADWLVSRMHYTSDRFFAAPAVRPAQIVAWLAGFAVYQWLYPNGPSWWLSFIHHETAPYDVTASLPSFAASFLLAAVAGLVARPRRALAET